MQRADTEEGIVRLRILFFGLLLSLAGPALSQDKNFSFRSYDLPRHGTLQLSVPRTWNDQLVPPKKKGGPPTIVFSSETGTDFNMRITPLWAMQGEVVPQNINDIRRSVTTAIEDAKSVSLETEIPMQDLQGTAGSGYYFSVTDRAPKPGEFKFMTQGMLLVGDLVLGFTLLSNEGAETAVGAAMAVLKTARFGGAASR